MSKKKMFAPVIFLDPPTPPPVDPGDGGDGTDHGGNDPYNGNATAPVSYAEWAKRLHPDRRDQWWADNGFGMDAWTEFNPNASFTWNPEDDL